MAEHLTQGTRSRFRSLQGLREERLGQGSFERATRIKSPGRRVTHVKKWHIFYFTNVQQTKVLEPENSLRLSAVWFLSK